MDARMLAGCVATLLGFACAYAAAFSAWAEIRKRWTSLAAQGEDRSAKALLFWRLRNGYAPVVFLAERLLRVRAVSSTVGELCAFCLARGCATTPEAALSVAVVLLGLLSGAAYLITGSAVGAVAVPACGIAVLGVVLGNERDKRQESVRDAVPNALESMSACFGSGFTLLQTFKQVAEDVSGPLGETFEKSAHVLEMGGSAESALAELREGAHASELAFVAVALDVQHQSGGAMRQVLDAASDTVKGELALRRALRVQTAQAKLSARVVAIMPFILVAAFSMASPDFLSPFFESAAGYVLLTVALVMQVAGVILVRRALAVDGVA